MGTCAISTQYRLIRKNDQIVTGSPALGFRTHWWPHCNLGDIKDTPYQSLNDLASQLRVSVQGIPQIKKLIENNCEGKGVRVLCHKREQVITSDNEAWSLELPKTWYKYAKWPLSQTYGLIETKKDKNKRLAKRPVAEEFPSIIIIFEELTAMCERENDEHVKMCEPCAEPSNWSHPAAPKTPALRPRGGAPTWIDEWHQLTSIDIDWPCRTSVEPKRTGL